MRSVFLSAAFALLSALGAQAAELVMIEQNGCHWCERWNEDIGVMYHKTDESRRAPLRRVNIHKLPDDLRFDSRPVFTPTFVLMNNGEELARIEGYPGEDFFWPMLNQIMDAHPDATVPQL